MNKETLRWLDREIPIWRERGWLNKEAAERLRAYYTETLPPKDYKILIAIFSVIGGSLAGLGIILLVAHNWDAMNRPMRTLFSFLPLVLAQAASGWVLWRGREGAGSREGTASFLFFAIGASIGLVSQTYHINQDVSVFLLTWMLLGLPVVYLQKALVPILIYAYLLLLWTMGQDETLQTGAYLVLLTAAIVPPVWGLLRGPRSERLWMLFYMVTLLTLLTIAYFGVLRWHEPGWMLVIASGLAAFWIAIGHFGGSVWGRCCIGIGLAGQAVVLFTGSFSEFWGEVALIKEKWLYASFDFYFGLLLLALTVYLLWLTWHGRGPKQWLTFTPLAITVAIPLAELDGSGLVPAVFINLVLLATAVYYMRQGVLRRHWLELNMGLLLMAGTVTMRFFDWDLSSLVRGLAFLVTGLGFLAVNFYMVRKAKEGP